MKREDNYILNNKHLKYAVIVLLLVFSDVFAQVASKPEALNAKQQAILKMLLPSLNKNKISDNNSLNSQQEFPVLPEALMTGVSVGDVSQNTSANVVIPKAQTVPGEVDTVMAVGELNRNAAQTAKKNNNNKDTLIKLESEYLIGDVNHSQIIMRWTSKPFYKLSTDDTHQIITLIIDDVDPDSLLSPLDMGQSVLSRIHYEYNNQHQLVITLFAHPMAEIQGLRMMGGEPTEFVLDIGMGALPQSLASSQNSAQFSYAHGTKSTGPYQPLVKKISAYTSQTQEQARLYNKALELIDRQELVRAATLLEKTLVQYPLFEPARVALGEVYLSQNNAPLALKSLTAIDVGNEPIENHVDYYTVLAETYRQSGDYRSALKIYQALLNFGPENAVWWMGYGLSEEGLGQKEAAKDAFQRAKRLGNLPAELQAMVN